MRRSLLILAALALGASVTAHAQNGASVRYKWYDGQGLMHFSDSLTADAMKYGYDLVDERGIVVQHVPRQLSAQERAAAAKLAQAEAARQRAAQEVATAEAQMLNAYPDEASYKASQQQTLDAIDQQIHTSRINLRSQEKALTDLLARAAETESAKKPVPKFLVDAITAQRNTVTALRNTLQRQQDTRDRTVREQAGQLARYRALKAEQDRAAE